ncbi:hypothetical protein FXB40_01180 [Bradyrhizobium rifense]|uniref:Uncharacterized protein n=1 Tax=Bradyrhizobium rifense TaxID=515499 RepID=A0A5D3KP49_9BRAD|nr:hypothetical protein [Bradyrhizobium rifense]TYM00149.1 hypothetical protein FXB40_01180 [Bradyrhizobium rifense]
MSALEAAGVTEAASRLTVIDEIERGLEPYRPRQLLAKLVKDGINEGLISTEVAPFRGVKESGNGRVGSSGGNK